MTKQILTKALQDLYELQTAVNVEEIKVKRMEALTALKSLHMTYKEGYELFRKYSHSQREFNIIMQYARGVLV